MRSLPTRSGPIRGERPRSQSDYLTRSRPSASKRGLRKATTRTARASHALARCPRPRHGHPPHRDRSHGARCEGATANHDPAPGEWLGRPAGRAARRSRRSIKARRRNVALNCADDRAGPRSYASGRRPARIAAVCLLQLHDLQKRHDRIDGRDLHPSHPLPLVGSRPPCRGCARDGKEMMSAALLVSADPAVNAHGYWGGRHPLCSEISKKPEEIDRRHWH